jgi:hypothetical protein
MYDPVHRSDLCSKQIDHPQVVSQHVGHRASRYTSSAELASLQAHGVQDAASFFFAKFFKNFSDFDDRENALTRLATYLGFKSAKDDNFENNVQYEMPLP